MVDAHSVDDGNGSCKVAATRFDAIIEQHGVAIDDTTSSCAFDAVYDAGALPERACAGASSAMASGPGPAGARKEVIICVGAVLQQGGAGAPARAVGAAVAASAEGDQVD